MSKPFSQSMTRRQALELLGLTAAVTALPRNVFGQAPTFPKGAIIRTILKDYEPEELAGGAHAVSRTHAARDGLQREIFRSISGRSSSPGIAAGPRIGAAAAPRAVVLLPPGRISCTTSNA
jgi:hypothetical protein